LTNVILPNQIFIELISFLEVVNLI